MSESKTKQAKCRGCGKPHSGRGRLGRRTLYCGRCKPESLRARWRSASARHEKTAKQRAAAVKKARASKGKKKSPVTKGSAE